MIIVGGVFDEDGEGDAGDFEDAGLDASALFVVKYGDEASSLFFFPEDNEEDKAFPLLSKAISATERFVSAFDNAASSGLSGENHAKGSGLLLTFATLNS